MYQKLHEASDYVNESDDSMMQKKVMQTRHPNFYSLHLLFIEPRNQFCSKMFVSDPLVTSYNIKFCI